METRVHLTTTSSHWKELYKAALFEDNNDKLPQRIAAAERALSERAAEMAGAGETQVREQQAMENAKYFLRLIRKIEGWANTPSEIIGTTARSSNVFPSEGAQHLHTVFSPSPSCNE